MGKVIDKLAWILVKDGQFLAVRSEGKSLFYLPGGKRESAESDQKALIREIREELSVDLIPESIVYAETFVAPADGKAEGVNVKLTCYFANFQGELSADAEIEELRFIGKEDQAICSLAALEVLNWLVKSNQI